MGKCNYYCIWSDTPCSKLVTTSLKAHRGNTCTEKEINMSYLLLEKDQGRTIGDLPYILGKYFA